MGEPAAPMTRAEGERPPRPGRLERFRELARTYRRSSVPAGELISAALPLIAADALDASGMADGLDERGRQHLVNSVRVLAEGGVSSVELPVRIYLLAGVVRRSISSGLADIEAGRRPDPASDPLIQGRLSLARSEGIDDDGMGAAVDVCETYLDVVWKTWEGEGIVLQ